MGYVMNEPSPAEQEVIRKFCEALGSALRRITDKEVTNIEALTLAQALPRASEDQPVSSTIQQQKPFKKETSRAITWCFTGHEVPRDALRHVAENVIADVASQQRTLQIERATAVRAAPYIRVSRLESRETSYSMQIQPDRAADYARNQGWTIVGSTKIRS
jgi:hypothetical protein